MRVGDLVMDRYGTVGFVASQSYCKDRWNVFWFDGEIFSLPSCLLEVICK